MKATTGSRWAVAGTVLTGGPPARPRWWTRARDALSRWASRQRTFPDTDPRAGRHPAAAASARGATSLDAPALPTAVAVPEHGATPWDPGAAMDVAVLERVYGAVRVRGERDLHDVGALWDWRPAWRFPDGTVLAAARVPLYSLDTEAAWHLLVTLTDLGWTVDVRTAGATAAAAWRATARRAHPARTITVDAPTAALAICRLALWVAARSVPAAPAGPAASATLEPPPASAYRAQHGAKPDGAPRALR